MRLLLVLLLVNGLAPDLAEAGEAVVHWARTGHAAHTVADHGDLGDQGREHGCGATHHRCSCCAGQAVALPGEIAVAVSEHDGGGAPAPCEARVAARTPARPFRPPIC